MNAILAIFKKEIKRFFTDKRLLLSLLLPGLLIYVVYTLMGSFMGDMLNPTDANYQVYVYNQAQSHEAINNPPDLDITITQKIGEVSSEDIQKLKDEEISLIIFFENDFDTKMQNGEKPKVTIHFLSSSITSSTVYSYYNSTFSAVSVKDVNYIVNAPIDYATSEDMSGMFLGMLMPFLLVVLLVTGCLAVASESIAGEKERGTMATLLVTPVKREYIAVGKILALSVVSIMSATSSFLGVMLSLPKLMGGAMGESLPVASLAAGNYLAIFAIVLGLVLLFNMVLSIVSCYAKSVKEASQLATPVLLIVIVMAVPTLVNMGQVQTNPLLYLIPIYNALQCLTALFSGSFSLFNFLMTVGVNLLITAIGVYILAKMFDSEKMMFDK